jgi:hypothetical protein
MDEEFVRRGGDDPVLDGCLFNDGEVASTSMAAAAEAPLQACVA